MPNVSADDAYDWTEESFLIHGYSSTDDVPAEKETLILLRAQAEGAFQISLASAHYFNYTDGDESVDKTMVSEQYRKIAQDIRNQYDDEKRRNNGAKSGFMKRADR